MSEQKILLISGAKQSGKSSAMNYLSGYLLKKSGLIQHFELDEEGKLLIDCDVEDPTTGETKKELGWLDLTRKDPEYTQNAVKKIWPIVKPYHFADNLKEVAIVVFGLNREEVYGTDDDKNKLCNVKWADLGKVIRLPKLPKGEVRPEYLTNREFLERFGTEVCRTLYNNCWIESCFKQVVGEDWPLCIIPDCRYPDEVEYAKNIGAKVVRLTRRPFQSEHVAETSLDDYTGFDAVIDNANMTQEEKGQELVKIVQSFGWVS